MKKKTVKNQFSPQLTTTLYKQANAIINAAYFARSLFIIEGFTSFKLLHSNLDNLVT